jgi:hypothetical protein
MTLVRPIEVTPEQSRRFRDEGALTLKPFLTEEGIRTIREMVEVELSGAGSGPGGKNDFKRARYDVGNRNPVTRRLLESPELRKTMRALTPGRLIFTQGIGFELTPGKAGLDWHFDFLSFGFIHPMDQAYTIWIPFDLIDPQAQRGGLEYVPETALSGRDKMVLSYRHVMRGPGVIEELGGREKYRALMPCAESERIILDAERVEPAFRPGDALLTDRFVWHRSCPLQPGPVRRRLAFILRFVDASARYDGTFCRKLGEFSVAYGNPNFKTEFGLSFSDIKDGDPIGSSRFAVPLE